MSNERKVWGYKALEDDDEMKLPFKDFHKIMLRVIDIYTRNAISVEQRGNLKSPCHEDWELIKDALTTEYRKWEFVRANPVTKHLASPITEYPKAKKVSYAGE